MTLSDAGRRDATTATTLEGRRVAVAYEVKTIWKLHFVRRWRRPQAGEVKEL